MQKRKIGSRLEVDIHGMVTAEAKKALEQLLSAVPQEITEITVIHGYQGGTSLQTMVRTKLKHRRIERKILGLNPGVTELLLRAPLSQNGKKPRR